jgi:repressor LexA
MEGRTRRRRGEGDLTPRQRDILAALEQAIARTGYVPSVRELGAAVGLRSTATVHNHLHQLERRGYIRRAPSQARAIEVLMPTLTPRQALRPVRVLGRVPAGPARLAVEEAEGTLALPIAFVSQPSPFALRVRGDSMVGAGIQDGDYVVVEPRDHADLGTIVVALLGDEATVKRLELAPDGPRLVAENPAYPPVPARDVRILGRVVGVYRTL